jgi:GNAT superfamily N-acetyltransferase
MAPVAVRPRVPEDDQRLVDISNAIYPHHPPLSVELLRYYVALGNRDERDHEERLVAERDGRVVGGLVFEKQWWVTQPGVFWARLTVDPALWGQGIGTALYRRLLERVADLGGIRLYGHVPEDQPHALTFVERRGFTRTGRSDRSSRLEVREANLAGYEDVEERLRREGLRIATVAELGTDNEPVLRGLYHLEHETAKDIPSSEELGENMSFELWKEIMIDGPERDPAAYWVALDGDRPVGMARLRVRDSIALNSYTGTDRAYRGRGIARALKLKTIEWCRANGVEYIYTGNDIDNQRMLAINIRLGYEPLPSDLEVVKELADAGSSA